MKKFQLFKSALALATATHVLMATPGQSQGFASSRATFFERDVGRNHRYARKQFRRNRRYTSDVRCVGGQVNAAEAGLLFSTDVTVMTIGAQNIISINGDSNSVTSNQDASSTGNVSTQSDISMGQR